MRLEYDVQINPFPIILSIGTIKKPKLNEIFDNLKGMSFEKFIQYEIFLKLTPEEFYTKVKKNEGGISFWCSLDETIKSEMTLYDIIVKDEQLQKIYIEILNFFFIEKVIFEGKMFLLLKSDSDDYSVQNIKGIINRENFNEILNILCQICCINSDEVSKDVKFKNNLAKKLYEKMLNSQKNSKLNFDLTIPNIISSVATMHSSLNYINIWDLTIFQLWDSFYRLRANSFFDIDKTRVSVWGDKDNVFDPARWYKNYYNLNHNSL